MDRTISIILILMISVGLAYFFWQESTAKNKNTQLEEVEIVQQSTVERNVAEPPQVKFPVPDAIDYSEIKEQENEPETIQAEELPLPDLNDSDQEMRAALENSYDVERLARLFLFDDFIRRFVVTIDNLTARKLSQRFVFTVKPENRFLVKQSDVDEVSTLDTENYSRYTPYISFITAVSDEKIVAIYVRYYSLFQESYEELGYPDAYFNDRLIEVIDHLLQTPTPAQPIFLKQPKVYFQFVNPELEALSAGQKIIIRIGEENARIIKTKLSALRTLLTTLQPVR